MSLIEQSAEVPFGGSALFSVEPCISAGETVLKLRGELDLWTQPLLAAALADVNESVACVVLDLSELTFIDASNAGIIRQSQISAAQRGVTLVLRSPNRSVLKVLELTGLFPVATA